MTDIGDIVWAPCLELKRNLCAAVVVDVQNPALEIRFCHDSLQVTVNSSTVKAFEHALALEFSFPENLPAGILPLIDSYNLNQIQLETVLKSLVISLFCDCIYFIQNNLIQAPYGTPTMPMLLSVRKLDEIL